MEIILLITFIIIIVLAFLKLFVYIAPILLGVILINFILKSVKQYKSQKEYEAKNLEYDDDHYGATLIDEDFVLGKRETINKKTVHSVEDENFFNESHEVIDATIIEE